MKSGTALLLRARSITLSTGLTVLLSGYVAAWPAAGFVIQEIPGGSARGVGFYELAAVLLSILLPLMALSPFSYIERSSARRWELVICSLVALLFPIIPFVAWYASMNATYITGTPLPNPLSMIGYLLFLSLVGRVLVSWLGRVWGSSLFILSYAVLIASQARWSTTGILGAFPTATRWDFAPALLIGALALGVITIITTNGTARKMFVLP